MTMGVLESIRNGWLNDIRDAIDAGAGQGKLKMMTDPRPETGGAETAVVATPFFSATSAPDASSGVLTFNSFTDDTGIPADGTTTWARATDSDDAFVADLSVGRTWARPGDTTSGSASITGIADTSDLLAGQAATGPGMPAGATIITVDSGTAVTISDNATATATAAALVFNDATDILLSNNDLTAGSDVRITSGTITAGNA